MQEAIEEKLRAHLNLVELRLEVQGNQFRGLIVSDDFEGLSEVKRQQMIYSHLQAYILDGRLHAVVIKTFTAQEWKEHQWNML